MSENESKRIEVQSGHSISEEKRKEWRKKMSDRTFSLEDPPNLDDLNSESNSFVRQDQSMLECRLEHVAFYSWIEAKLNDLRTTLQRRGLDEQKIEEKEKSIVEKFQDFFQTLIDIENKENQILQSQIETIFNETIRLNRLLKLDETIEKINNENVSLLEQLNLVKAFSEKINEVLRIKIQEIQRLRSIEANFCEKLKEKPIEFIDEELPYDQREEILEQHIEELTNFQTERSSTICRCREEIQRLNIELELNSKFHQVANDEEIRNLIERPVNSIELSNENVEKLVKITTELNEIFQSNRDKAERLAENLQAIYERLNLLDCEKRLKLPLDQSHRPTNLLALQNEIERCKELRRQNMKVYIENIRDEIFAQYEKCFYGREQMESFLPLYSNEFTEELLEEHEKELEEIHFYYRHNEELFTNLAHWHEIWAEYREFQRQASDPDRFKRRGYSAVQEEKQRKHLEFTLKKLQETVLQLSQEYEREFQHPFLVEGVAVHDFFNNEKENYSQEKELEKARKQLARGQTPTSSHVQSNLKRLEFSSKTPGRPQSNLGKESDVKPATPFRPMSALHKR